MVSAFPSLRTLSAPEAERITLLVPEFGASEGSDGGSAAPYILPAPLAAAVQSADAGPADMRAARVRILACAAVVAVGALALRQPILLPALLLPAAAEYLLLLRKGFARAERFERDYTALLLSLSSAVRTGLDPISALLKSDGLFAEGSEVRKEIVRMRGVVDRGGTEQEAIRAFGATIAHPDLPLFRAALLLSRKEGSPISSCLRRLAKVTRQRQSFRRRVKAAVAMQKLSAIGIALCAAVIGAMQFVANPEGLRTAWQHHLGCASLSLGAVLMALGIAWMYLLTKGRL